MTHIELEGTINTRDLGAYFLDNININKGVLFRSDKLSNLTENDINKLKNLGIKRIVDFRSELEKSREPNIIPNGIKYIEMPISVDKKMNEKLKDILSGNNDKDIRDFLIDANKEFVLDHQSVFSNFLKDLVKYKEPTLFHCTAGKDRTGFASYLIYSICGIDEDFIILDYLSSNKYIEKNLEKQFENISKIMGLSIEEAREIEPILRVDIDYITSAIDTINENYNSVQEFITNTLNFSLREQDQLKELLISKY